LIVFANAGFPARLGGGVKWVANLRWLLVFFCFVAPPRHPQKMNVCLFLSGERLSASIVPSFLVCECVFALCVLLVWCVFRDRLKFTALQTSCIF
jgi:hypothetical protein